MKKNNQPQEQKSGSKKSLAPETKKQIIKWTLIGLLIAFLIFAIFAKAIFGDTNQFADFISINIGNPANLWAHFKSNLNRVVKSLTYVALIWLVSSGLRWLIKIIFARGNRSKTIVHLVNSFIKYTAMAIAIWLVLKTFGVNTATLLASAGIIALVIGLGAQPLIADVLAGLSIIFEAEYRVGDIVVIDNFRGTVVEIGLRTTRFADVAGNMKIINNSEIRNVVNMSDDLSIALCDVLIEYSQSLEKAELVLQESFAAMRKNIPAIISGPFYKGVQDFAEDGMLIRVLARVKEEDKYQTERDMRREIKISFDQHNINIPFRQVVINEPTESKDDATFAEKQKARDFMEKQKAVSGEFDNQQGE